MAKMQILRWTSKIFQNSYHRNLTYRGAGKSLVRNDNSYMKINLLTPNVNYSGRTAPLTSKVAFYIFSTNIGTEYFKHGIYSPFFLLKIKFV